MPSIGRFLCYVRAKVDEILSIFLNLNLDIFFFVSRFRSENRDQYCLAYPYYVMGNLSIDQVYRRILTIVGDIPQNAVTMKGAIHTLKSMILKYSDDNEELSRRLTAYIDSHKNHTFGEKLLEFIAKYAPNELAVIGLNSTIFRDTMSNRMCETILQTNANMQL